MRCCATGGAPTEGRTRTVGKVPPPPPPHQQQEAAGGPAASSGRVRVEDPDPSEQPGAHVGTEGSYDPWAILGLQKGASAHDIRVRYHDLMKKYHPTFAEDGEADIDKWTEVDRAHNLITQAPTVDSRFNLHMDGNQQAYYSVLPEWMARNVDDKPRYWSWFRHRLPPLPFWITVGFLSFIVGRLALAYPMAVPLFGLCVVLDVLFATQLMPFMFLYIVIKAYMSELVDVSWLMSPKGFMQRGLLY
jgi:hypothetical protein